MNILEEVRKKDLLIEPVALEHLKKAVDPLALLEACETHLKGGFIITHSIIDEALREQAASLKAMQVETHVKKIDYAPVAAGVGDQVIISEKKIERIVGELNDFTKYFQSRFTQLSEVLKMRRSEHGYATISRAKQTTDRTKLRIIGMVIDSRETKNGHRLIEIEDFDDVMPCLASKTNAKLLELSAQVLQDDTIALDGFMSKGLFIIDDIVWPDVPLRQKKLASEDVSIAFISDTHVGSKYFMQHEFQKFIKFLNGDTEMVEEASKIKYLLVAGDLVDGVGVYPSQEEQLVTKSIFKQYEAFCDYFEEIPEHIKVIIAPGNHDAVRTAEPSPRIASEFVQKLESKKNIVFVGNPAFVDIHGLKVLMYHGTSVDSVIRAMPSLSDGYDCPEKVAVELLKRRHLAPVYGERPLIPLHHDDMVIAQVPDILHFGHVHKNGYTNYRGTFIVNSGTWQDRTDYQVKQGHHPSPCEVPIYNIKTGSLKVLNFKDDVQGEK